MNSAYDKTDISLELEEVFSMIDSLAHFLTFILGEWSNLNFYGIQKGQQKFVSLVSLGAKLAFFHGEGRGRGGGEGRGAGGWQE